MRIGFFPNMGKANIMEVLKEACRICGNHGIEVFIPNDLEGDHVDYDLGLDADHVLPRPEIFRVIDMAFSFGGDGTIIQLAREIYAFEVPICGINLGELGFLNQIEVEQLPCHIDRLAKGDYYTENRNHLCAYIQREDGTKEDLVPIINEIVVTKSQPAKMARINLAINGRHTQMYPADGLIVSSATGSTGYNLSAGYICV